MEDARRTHCDRGHPVEDEEYCEKCEKFDARQKVEAYERLREALGFGPSANPVTVAVLGVDEIKRLRGETPC